MANERPQAETLYCTASSTTPPAPYSGASWQYEVRFDIGAGESVRQDEFFPYAEHTVEVDLDDTDCSTRLGYEYDYTPSNGFVLLVTIDEAGNVHVDNSGNLPA